MLSVTCPYFDFPYLVVCALNLSYKFISFINISRFKVNTLKPVHNRLVYYRISLVVNFGNVSFEIAVSQFMHHAATICCHNIDTRNNVRYFTLNFAVAIPYLSMIFL